MWTAGLTDLVGLEDVAADGDASTVSLLFDIRRRSSGTVTHRHHCRTGDWLHSKTDHDDEQVADVGDVRDCLQRVVHYHVLHTHTVNDVIINTFRRNGSSASPRVGPGV